MSYLEDPPVPAVGDINSEAKGTGARYNAGKPPVELLLWGTVADTLQSDVPGDLVVCLHNLGMFQETHETVHLRHLLRTLYDGDLRRALLEGAQVFGFGAKKYKAWNWAKGMAWSVPLACIGRHLLAIAFGEELDPESGLPHRGHIVCNVQMLIAYECHFPEGNDLPTVFLAPSPEQIHNEMAIRSLEKAAREPRASFVTVTGTASTGMLSNPVRSEPVYPDYSRYDPAPTSKRTNDHG